MPIFFKVRNKTKRDLTNVFRSVVAKLQPFFRLIPPSKYPLHVIVLEKQFPGDHSNWEDERQSMILKIWSDESKQSDADLEWVILHEFAHVVQSYNIQIKKASHYEEDEALRQLLMKIFHMSWEQVEETFHDFLPSEVYGNSFASMLTGHFYKRHPFKPAEELLKKVQVDKK